MLDDPAVDFKIPSGKRLHSAMENHHFLWENPLFLWPFSIAMLVYQRVFESLETKKNCQTESSVGLKPMG